MYKEDSKLPDRVAELNGANANPSASKAAQRPVKPFKGTPSSCWSVFVGNLPPRVTEKALSREFSSIPDFVGVRVFKCKRTGTANHAFVDYSSLLSAGMASQMRELYLYGHKLHISLANNVTQGSNQKTMKPKPKHPRIDPWKKEEEKVRYALENNLHTLQDKPERDSIVDILKAVSFKIPDIMSARGDEGPVLLNASSVPTRLIRPLSQFRRENEAEDTTDSTSEEEDTRQEDSTLLVEDWLPEDTWEKEDDFEEMSPHFSDDRSSDEPTRERAFECGQAREDSTVNQPSVLTSTGQSSVDLISELGGLEAMPDSEYREELNLSGDVSKEKHSDSPLDSIFTSSDSGLSSSASGSIGAGGRTTKESQTFQQEALEKKPVKGNSFEENWRLSSTQPMTTSRLDVTEQRLLTPFQRLRAVWKDIAVAEQQATTVGELISIASDPVDALGSIPGIESEVAGTVQSGPHRTSADDMLNPEFVELFTASPTVAVCHNLVDLSCPSVDPLLESLTTPTTNLLTTPTMEPLTALNLDPLIAPTMASLTTPTMDPLTTPITNLQTTLNLDLLIIPTMDSLTTPTMDSQTTPTMDPLTTPITNLQTTLNLDPLIMPTMDSLTTPTMDSQSYSITQECSTPELALDRLLSCGSQADHTPVLVPINLPRTAAAASGTTSTASLPLQPTPSFSQPLSPPVCVPKLPSPPPVVGPAEAHQCSPVPPSGCTDLAPVLAQTHQSTGSTPRSKTKCTGIRLVASFGSGPRHGCQAAQSSHQSATLPSSSASLSENAADTLSAGQHRKCPSPLPSEQLDSASGPENIPGRGSAEVKSWSPCQQPLLVDIDAVSEPRPLATASMADQQQPHTETANIIASLADVSSSSSNSEGHVAKVLPPAVVSVSEGDPEQQSGEAKYQSKESSTSSMETKAEDIVPAELGFALLGQQNSQDLAAHIIGLSDSTHKSSESDSSQPMKEELLQSTLLSLSNDTWGSKAEQSTEVFAEAKFPRQMKKDAATTVEESEACDIEDALGRLQCQVTAINSSLKEMKLFNEDLAKQNDKSLPLDVGQETPDLERSVEQAALAQLNLIHCQDESKRSDQVWSEVVEAWVKETTFHPQLLQEIELLRDLQSCRRKLKEERLKQDLLQKVPTLIT